MRRAIRTCSATIEPAADLSSIAHVPTAPQEDVNTVVLELRYSLQAAEHSASQMQSVTQRSMYDVRTLKKELRESEIAKKGV